MKKDSLIGIFKKASLTGNPIFVMVLGMCPTLATSTSASNALGMGLSVTFVLLCSCVLVSALRKLIPDQVRIPCFIVLIASFSTIVQLLLKAYFPALDASLGIFIPLIVVNCIILERVESFASKNGVIRSAIDALGTGLGFTVALMIIGIVRELLGNGTVFNITIVPEAVPPMTMFTMAPGGFIVLGTALAVIAAIRSGRKKV